MSDIYANFLKRLRDKASSQNAINRTRPEFQAAIDRRACFEIFATAPETLTADRLDSVTAYDVEMRYADLSRRLKSEFVPTENAAKHRSEIGAMNERQRSRYLERQHEIKNREQWAEQQAAKKKGAK